MKSFETATSDLPDTIFVTIPYREELVALITALAEPEDVIRDALQDG